MAKARAKFVCQNCGTSYAKWAGRCENCGEWNTLLEQEVPTEAEAKSALARGAVSGKKLAAVSINEIEPSDAGSRLKTGFPELDNVLGGGILLGGVALLAGQPGMGKSTILMQVCANVSRGKSKCARFVLVPAPTNSILQALLPRTTLLKPLRKMAMTS